MECIATSYAPLILEPDSSSDWTRQHVLTEQLRQAEHKQPTTTTITLNSSTTTKRLSATHANPPSSKRPRHKQQNTLLLHIPGPGTTTSSSTNRVHKYVVTPTNAKTPIKSPQHWAALLSSATANLQTIYASSSSHNNNHLQPPPAAPKARPILPSERPEFEGLDRVQLASRAMQMAAGFGRASAAAARSGDDSDGESSGSESEVEAPATPLGVEEGVMMDIDPRLFS